MKIKKMKKKTNTMKETVYNKMFLESQWLVEIGNYYYNGSLWSSALKEVGVAVNRVKMSSAC